MRITSARIESILRAARAAETSVEIIIDGDRLTIRPVAESPAPAVDAADEWLKANSGQGRAAKGA